MSGFALVDDPETESGSCRHEETMSQYQQAALSR